AYEIAHRRARKSEEARQLLHVVELRPIIQVAEGQDDEDRWPEIGLKEIMLFQMRVDVDVAYQHAEKQRDEQLHHRIDLSADVRTGLRVGPQVRRGLVAHAERSGESRFQNFCIF